MSASLNVIALVSGGKDSLYSLLHCIQNGHNVVALANLYPPRPPPAAAPTSSPPDQSGRTPAAEPEPEPDDLNSFMYQTVGHSLVPLYAAALRLPLYRRAIAGSATQTGRSYDPTLASATGADETEDLVPLLRQILQHHPAATAVSSGAILSTYQRTRIESVARRLGLTPLAFLWQYPALPPSPSARGESLTGLLDDMAAAGCSARIVKIASGGLEEGMLWADVTSQRTRRGLVQGMAPFVGDDEMELRAAVLGEGGEYETIAAGGPRAVWRGGRIEVGSTEVVSEDGGVCWVRAVGARVVGDADAEGEENESGTSLVRTPGMFDPQFEAVLERVMAERKAAASSINLPSGAEMVSTHDGGQSISGASKRDHHPKPPQLPSTLSHTQILNTSANALQISNLTATPHISIEDQATEILNQLRSTLQSLTPTDTTPITIDTTKILSTTLLLRSITSFAAVNAIYATLFPPGMPNPPARVAVACGNTLPEGVDLSLSVLLDLGNRGRWRGLHVQGRSYWAPANIGAYSQAIALPLVAGGDEVGFEVVHVAGQIPLVPASMEMYKAGLGEQAVLSLQHLWRVGQERRVDLWTWGVSFLDGTGSEGADAERVSMAWETWRLAHEAGTRLAVEESVDKQEDDEDDGDGAPGMDAWDLKNNRSAGFGFDMSKMTVGEHLHLLPNPRLCRILHPEGGRTGGSAQSYVPPLIVVEVEALPRGAPIEWHSLGLGSLVKHSGETKGMNCKNFSRSWGHVNVLSIPLSDKLRDREENEEGDESQEGTPNDSHVPKKVVDVNFVTLMVFETRVLTADADIERKLPEISAVLREIFNSSPTSSSSKVLQSEDPDLSTSSSIDIIHSTVYISPMRSESTARDIQVFAGATIIPCRKVWGSAGLERPQELSMAVTMRVDVENTRDRYS